MLSSRIEYLIEQALIFRRPRIAPPLRAWARKKLNLYSSSKNELVNTTGEMFFQRLCAETPGHRDAQNRDRAVQAPLTKAAIDLRANISRNSHRRKKHIDSKNKRH
jgi:hypothetical protein